MDDEEKFGPVLHRLTFGQAIERDLLSDYQVVVVGVDDEAYRDLAERGAFVTRDGTRSQTPATLARQIGLAKAMRKYDLHRVVSFHSRIARARSSPVRCPRSSPGCPLAAARTGALWTDHVSGEMTAGERDVRLDGFGDSRPASAACSPTPAAWTKASMCPRSTASPSSTPGAPRSMSCRPSAGRSERPRQAAGTIVLPVFVSRDDDPEQALDAAFNRVWDVSRRSAPTTRSRRTRQSASRPRAPREFSPSKSRSSLPTGSPRLLAGL